VKSLLGASRSASIQRPGYAAAASGSGARSGNRGVNFGRQLRTLLVIEGAHGPPYP